MGSSPGSEEPGRRPTARPESTFHGFADDLPNLEEFHSSDGHHVEVLGMECIAFDFRPLTQELIVTFEGLRTETLPEEIATLTFSDAHIYQWVDIPPGNIIITGDRPRVRGEVNSFDYVGDGCFSISLFDQWISWVAGSVRCEVTTRDAGPPQDS